MLIFAIGFQMQFWDSGELLYFLLPALDERRLFLDTRPGELGPARLLYSFNLCIYRIRLNAARRLQSFTIPFDQSHAVIAVHSRMSKW